MTIMSKFDTLLLSLKIVVLLYLLIYELGLTIKFFSPSSIFVYNNYFE